MFYLLRNHDFLLKNDDFLLKNDDFRVANDDFLLKNDVFIICTGSENQTLASGAVVYGWVRRYGFDSDFDYTGEKCFAGLSSAGMFY